MSRIVKQFGNGYGPTAVTIVAQIDGNTVYSGAVPTLNTPVPDYIDSQPGQQPHAECFSWTEAPGNTFTRSLSITVSNGTFQLGQTLAQANVANANQYTGIYDVVIGDFVYGDPLSNVVIGGEPMTRPLEQYPGQWNWNVPAGSTLTATMTCNVPPSGNV